MKYYTHDGRGGVQLQNLTGGIGGDTTTLSGVVQTIPFPTPTSSVNYQLSITCVDSVGNSIYYTTSNHTINSFDIETAEDSFVKYRVLE